MVAALPIPHLLMLNDFNKKEILVTENISFFFLYLTATWLVTQELCVTYMTHSKCFPFTFQVAENGVGLLERPVALPSSLFSQGFRCIRSSQELVCSLRRHNTSTHSHLLNNNHLGV